MATAGRSERKRILFLCTGNSCRSQMAEAIVNSRASDSWMALSAGTRPAGFVSHLAIRALQEIGIDATQARCKSFDEFRGQDFDIIVTVCDQASEECPLWLGVGKRFHIGFPDPAKAVGSEAEVMSTFRTVRNDIETRVLEFLRTK
jgi:arsenate reductase